MDDTNAFQLMKAGLLAVAGIAFVWWQLRDVDRARQQSADERRRRESADQREPASTTDRPPSTDTPSPP
jgi:hypothetical protein